MNKYEGYIAIDLGTTNSVAFVSDNQGNSVIIRNSENELLTPSFVWFLEDDMTGKVKYKVGSLAKSKMITDPENVVCSYKPLMGDNTIIKKVFGHRLTPEHCSALVLKYIKNCAEEQIGSLIDNAVITVPAYFTDVQKEATRHAAKQAGLNVLRLVAEPTAAAYHYGKANVSKDQGVKTVLTYDLGGGTFDISLINIMSDGSAQVLGVGGSKHLGGDNVDISVATYIAKKANILPKNGKFEELDINTQEILTRLGETVKVTLSKQYYVGRDTHCPANVLDVIDVKSYPNAKNVKITPKEFLNILEPIIDTTIEILDTTIMENNIDVLTIDEILLVGGSTRLPLIREKLIEFMVDNGVSEDKFPLSYFDDYIVDPDHAVAHGAFLVMKDIVNNQDNNLVDVVPQPIGVKLYDGTMNVVIRKGSPLPSIGRVALTNQFVGQTEMLIEVYQGMNRLAGNNQLLGTVSVPINSTIAQGAESINVKITVDRKGDIKVTALGATRHVLKINRYFDEDTMTVDDIMNDMSNKESLSTKDSHNKELKDKGVDPIEFGVKE